jgi:MFS family permease
MFRLFRSGPLSSSSFRHLVTALWVNDLGNAIGEVALAILVYDRTGSPLASASLFLALRFLPATVSPLLTAYAEALSPRIVLTILYVLEGCVFAGIATLTHHFSLPLILVLVAIDGGLAIVSGALARSAITNNLLPIGFLREGNGIANLGTMVAFAAGPVIGGLLVAERSASTALYADAATFLVTALVIVTTPKITIASDREAGASGRFKAGIAVLRERPAVRRMLIAMVLTFALGSVAVPIEVVFAQTTLHAGSSGYGLLITAWGVGMIGGGLLFTLGAEVPLMRLLGFTTGLVAVGYLGLAISPTLAVACAFSCVGGTGNGAAWVAAMTAIQERIPLNAQSSVMSVLYGLDRVMPALAFVIGGVIAAVSSPRIAYAVAGVGTALALVFFLIRPIDRVQLNTIGEQPNHDQPPEAQNGSAGDGEPEEIQAYDRNLRTTSTFS